MQTWTYNESYYVIALLSDLFRHDGENHIIFGEMYLDWIE